MKKKLLTPSNRLNINKKKIIKKKLSFNKSSLNIKFSKIYLELIWKIS